MAPLVAATLALAFLVSVHSAPTLPTVHNCHENDLWQSGSTYTYDYVAKMDTKATGMTNIVGGAKIKCTVELGALGQCRYTLKTAGCSLDEVPAGQTAVEYKPHAKSAEFKTVMEKYPVSFLMNDGEVQGMIANEQEPTSILNIKRGIISALLVKHDESDDEDELRTDVHGTCHVHYTVSGKHGEYEKDLSKCHFPTRKDFILSPYSFMSNLTFLQFFFLDSKAHCKYDFDGSAVSKVECDEKHAFNVESENNRPASMAASVHLSLKLQGTKAGVGTFAKKGHVTGIQYEWEGPKKPTISAADTLTKGNAIMADLVAKTQTEMGPHTVLRWDDLFDVLRASVDVVDFTKNVMECKFKSGCSDLDKELSMSYLRDALVTCNSVPCMKGVKMLAKSTETMSRNYFNVMMYALTKVKVDDPEYLTQVFDICVARPTRTCILSLTSMIHSFTERHGHHMPEALKGTVEHLQKLIGDDCTPDKTQPPAPHHKAIERTILALKAIGNLGHCAQHASKTIAKRLSSCIANHNLPHNITMEAIKAFRRMDPTPQIYTTLMNVVKDQKELKELRIVSYLTLTVLFQEDRLYDDLAKIINSDFDNQLRNFVAMHMTNALIYGTHEIQLLQRSIREAKNRHPGVFEVRGTHPLTSSRHVQRQNFVQNPDMHGNLGKFGIDITRNVIYETFSYLPQNLILNITSQLFGKTKNPLNLGVALHGLEPYLEGIFGPNSLLKRHSLEEIGKKLEKHQKSILDFFTDPAAFMEKTYNSHFDKGIEEKLNALHNSIKMDYGKHPQFASISVKLYGDELAYTSLDIIKDRIDHFWEHDYYEINWEDFHKYHAHRIIRFIEGSNQVPTMSGLPLYWFTEAALGFSIRANVKTDITGLLDDERNLDLAWDLNNSGVLTVYKNMRIEVPGFTRFGYGTINVVHRSRQRVGEFKKEGGNYHLKIQAPARQQVLFARERMNVEINGAMEKMIVEADIKHEDHCDSLKLTGLKYCKHRSYVESTHDLSRPWQLISGSSSLKISFEKEDEGLKEYDLNVKVDKSNLPIKKTAITFKAPGSKAQRTVNGNIERNVETNEFKINFNVPEKPHFKLMGQRTMKKEASGVHFETHIDAMIFEGRPITFHGERFIGTEAGHNVRKGSAKLTLKNRVYAYKRKYLYNDHSKVVNAEATYESDSSDSYMHEILPAPFWETDKKAKLDFVLDVQKKSNDDNWQRDISASIMLPKSELLLKTSHVHKGDDKHHLSLKLQKLADTKLQSFIYMNYDKVNDVQNEHTKRTHIAELLIPKVRWQAKLTRDIDPVDNKNTLVIKREKATDGSFEVTDASKVEEKHVTLVINHHNVSREKGENWPAPRERHIDASLSYPVEGKYFTVKYQGKIINTEGQTGAARSFNTDSNIESERLQLKIHANTDYIRMPGKKWSLHHKSDITSLRTGKTAKYVLNLDLDHGKTRFDLLQTFDSSFYTFREEGHVVKTGDDIDLKLTIKAHSDIWDLLNVDLDQAAKIGPAGGHETMTLRHKLFDIDVTSDFKLPLTNYYNKEIKFKSKTEYLPSFNCYIRHHIARLFTAHIEYPEEKRNVYGVIEVDPSLKGAELIVSYNYEGQTNHTVMDWQLRIITPHLMLGEFSTDVAAIKRAAARHADRYAKIKKRWEEIKSDPEHPLNKILKPIVKTTLADFQKELRERMERRKQAIRAAIQEAVQSLQPIYGTAVEVFRGIAQAIHKLAHKILQRDTRHKSVIVWMYQHYNVREKARAYYKRASLRALKRAAGIGPRTRSGAVVINHPFHWESFGKMPRLSATYQSRIQRFQKIRAALKKGIPEFRRFAVAYGNGHLQTFDGAHFSAPMFDKKCMFVMAHDFVFRRYTFLAQNGLMHILYPDVAITVDMESNVHINNGKKNEQLPLELDHGHVRIFKVDNFIVIHSDYGLNVGLNPKDFVLMASLDFWNHNRTLGLLGNNDNEAMNDFVSRTGERSKQFNKNFLLSWELSGQGGCNKMPAPKPCDKPVDPKCDTLFDHHNYNSPYAACFEHVDPEPFHVGCQEDTRCGMGSKSSEVAYTSMCHTKDITIGTEAA